MLHIRASIHRFLLILSMLTVATVALSQKPFITRVRFTLPYQEPVFQHVIQDKNGYLWLGSEKGLYRFDGRDFQQYYPAPGSPDAHVTTVYEDNEGVIWLGGMDGSIHFLDRGQFSSFQPEEGTASAGISGILMDHHDNLWWSTFGEGIYVFSEGRVYNFATEDGLSNNFVYGIILRDDGRVYAATDNGLSAVWIENGEKSANTPFDPERLPDIIVRSLREDGNGRLWLGFHDAGFGYIEESSGNFVVPPVCKEWEEGAVENLVFTGDVVWTGMISGEILQIHTGDPGDVLRWTRDDRGNPFGRINHLFEDREGNIWILSSGGLFRSTGTRMQFLDQAHNPAFHDVHAILTDAEGNLWFCNNDGVFRYDLSDHHLQKFLQESRFRGVHFMCLEQDRHGYIWAGTFDEGVFRIHPSTGRYRQITEKEGLVNNNVLSISSHRDTLWLATLGGASRMITRDHTLNGPLDIFSYNQENGLVNTFIYDVYEDDRDRIWFGTDGDGLCVFSEGKFTYYGEPEGIGDDVVYSVTGDSEGNIWFSTSSDGIYRFNGSVFSHYGTESGVRSPEISSLAVCGDEVMIVHGLGIDILHVPQMVVTPYGKESGLTEMGPELNAACTGPGCVFWAGTREGIVRYQSGEDADNFMPNTVLESISVFLEPIAMQEQLSLRNSQNHVSFTYSGVWLSDPDKVIYQVFLEGYDLGWKETFDRTATYSSLQPGDYVFRVRSAIDAAFAYSSEASFSFTIRKPFYATAWFIVILSCSLAAGIYLIIRFREKKLTSIEAQKKEKVEFEFQLLKNQVNPHFLFNSFSTLISLIEEKSDMALEYTERLSDFFRRVLQLKETEVISLREEMDLIRDYLFIQQKRYGDLIELKVSLDETTLRSLIPPMTLQILMENAIKHNIISKDKKLFISICREGDRLIVENSYQPKRKTETSTGIGLENISKRYRLFASRDIRTEQKDGRFRVELPLLEEK